MHCHNRHLQLGGSGGSGGSGSYCGKAGLTWISLRDNGALKFCAIVKHDRASRDKQMHFADLLCMCEGCRLRCMRTGGMTEC